MNTQRKHSAAGRRLLAFGILLGILLTAALLGAAVRPAPAAAAPGITTLAGAPGVPGTANGTATAARFSYARGVVVDTAGNVFVADTNSCTIRKITPAGVVTTFAGTAGVIGSADGTGAAASFNYPEGLARDTANNLYVADTQNNMIRKITPAGVVTTVAGQLGPFGTGGYVDGNVGVAMFRNPRGLAVDGTGNIWVADSGNNALREITPAGVVSTLAGGLGVFNNPRGVCVGTGGALFVADYGNQRIAQVGASGVVTNFAGSHTDGAIGGTVGSANGTGNAAQFYNPTGIVRASTGTFYVTDSGNNTIRAITAARVVTTFAGSPGVAGSTDGIYTAARFNDPRGIALDAANNVYVADRGNSTVRRGVSSVITITATAGPNGTITPAGAIGVVSGTNSTTFTITPATGYHRATVLVNGVNNPAAVTSGTYTFTNVTTNQTISATFAINTYTITPSVVGGNGTIAPSTVQTVNYGGAATFTMTPNVGYRVATVLVDGTNVPAAVTAGSYTFTNVTANHTIAVTFGPSSFTITSSVVGGINGHGTISPTPSVVVPAQGNQTFTMTPAAGYHVSDVTIDGTSVGNAGVNTYTFTNVLAAHSISVTFAANPTITSSAGPNGTVTPSGVTTVAYNGSQTYTIAGSAGYQVSNVLVDGVSVGAVASYTFTNVIVNHTISATFVPSTYTITPSVVGANGTISPNTVQTVTINTNSPAFTFTPATGYHIADVLIDGVSNPAAVTAGTYTFTNVIANHTIAVSFAINTFTITPSAGANGTITPGTVQTVNYGASQTFTIAGNTGFHVTDVLIDGLSVGPTASYTFTNVTANHTIWATFAQNTYTITPTAGANGTITPGTQQTVNYGGSQTFAIAGNARYHVLDVLVDGSSVGPVNSYTFTNVTATHTISATFVADPQITITYPAGGETLTNGGAGAVVTWTTPSSVAVGSFGVWAVSSGGSWTWLGAVNANGTASYSRTWTLAVPAGSYRVYVAYAPPLGSWTTSAYSAAPFTVTAGGLAVVSPNGGETVVAGGVGTTVFWTTGTPVATGVFGVWAVSSGGVWTWLGSSTASGIALYSIPWTNAVPAGSYRIYVAYGPTLGTWTSTVYSAAFFTVTP